VSKKMRKAATAIKHTLMAMFVAFVAYQILFRSVWPSRYLFIPSLFDQSTQSLSLADEIGSV